MDKKIANNVVLGIFVLLGVLAFGFFVFSIGGGQGVFKSQFSLFGKWTHVKGLHTGSEISLAGLRIGVVKDITVSPGEDKTLMVEMAIDKDARNFLREDSVAMIKTQGVLGDKYVEMTIGTPSLPPMKDGDTIVTQEEADLFSKSGKLVSGISQQFAEGGKIDLLLSDINRLVGNLNGIAKDVRSNKGVLHELIYGKSGDNLSKAIVHLEQVMKKLDKGKGTLGAFINDPTVYEDVKYLMGGAKRSTILKYFIRQFVESGDDKPKKGD